MEETGERRKLFVSSHTEFMETPPSFGIVKSSRVFTERTDK